MSPTKDLVIDYTSDTSVSLQIGRSCRSVYDFCSCSSRLYIFSLSSRMRLSGRCVRYAATFIRCAPCRSIAYFTNCSTKYLAVRGSPVERRIISFQE